jgi:FkbM family methyltransferase
MCFTLRANPLLGLAFLLFQKQFRIERMTFSVPLRDQPLGSLATYWFSDYEAPERSFCKRFIKPSDRVCELGGCLGVVSMVVNRLLTVPSDHLVVEANPEMIGFLERNREKNKGSFRILHRAVGDGNDVEMLISSGILTSTRSHENHVQSMRVKGCTLAELQAKEGPFDTLIMDIEGAETQVILESDDWKAMRLIILEWHPSIITIENVTAGRKRLDEAGFRCVATKEGDCHIVEAWEKNHQPN